MSVPAPERGRRRWWIIAAIVVAIAIVAVTVAVVAANTRPTPATVTLVASTTPGPNPFTGSVATGSPAAATPAVVAKSAALRKTLPTDKNTQLIVASGTVPGLYGGSSQERVCDPGRLVAYLAAHPDKASAWAGVQGIATAGIGAFVATLTPVLLNSDTLVTNYGFFDGKAEPFHAVLQAGTAVLVDAGGTPRAKCNCGNPLSPPELLNLATAASVGTPWPGYGPAQVTIVQAGKATGVLTLVDTASGDTYNVVPGEAPGIWVSAAVDQTANIPWTTTVSTSADGKNWTAVAAIPGEMVYSIASGNGVWVAAASQPWNWGRVTPPTQLFESTDLRTWHQVAALQDHVTGLAFADGHWTAVGYIVATAAGIVAWQSTDAMQWEPAAASLAGSSSGVQHLATAIHANGLWVGVVADPAPPAESFAAALPAPLSWTATSRDGLSWPTLNALPGHATDADLAYGAGQWLVAENQYASGAPGSNISTVALGFNATTWTDSPVQGLGTESFAAVAYGNGGWLAAIRPWPGSSDSIADSATTTFTASMDAKTWTPGTHVPLAVQALAFGPAPIAPGAGGATGGGTLVDGSYQLTVHDGATCIGMADGVALDHAVLTVNGSRSTIETADGFTFTGQFAVRTTHDFNIVDTTPAQNSTSMGIGLIGLVAADGTLSGQGTESPKTADAALDTCNFFFTGTLINTSQPTVAPRSATAPPPAAAPTTCDPATVLAVVNAGVPAGKQKTINPQDIRCTDEWITAGVNDPVLGDQNTVVLQRINGVWTLMDREAVCKSGAIPASLVQLGCHSN